MREIAFSAFSRAILGLNWMNEKAITVSDNEQTSENIINFENVYAGYDITPVLQNVNLRVNTNEHWVILGANGSGKSTLMKLFSNDLYPSAKYPYTKTIFGKERWDIFQLKENLGIITNDLHNRFEANGGDLTAYQVVLSGFYSSIGIFSHQKYTEEQQIKVQEVLDFLEITPIKDKKVSQMSTGQLRRCIIGRALIHEPKAFILDEPTVGLDIKAQNNFIKLIEKLSKKASIILVTHNIEEIFSGITHVALIHNKTIFKQGKKENVLTSENLSEIFGIKINLQKENHRYYIKSIDQ